MGTGNRAQSLDIAGAARVEATADRGETETSHNPALLRGQDELSDEGARETVPGESKRASSVSGEAIQTSAIDCGPASSGDSVHVKESAEVANGGSGQESTVWSSLRQPGAGGTSKLAASSSGAVRLLTLGRGGRVVQAPASSAGAPKRSVPGAEVLESTGRGLQHLEGAREGVPTSNAREIREPQVGVQQGVGSQTVSRGSHHVGAGLLRHASELTSTRMPSVTTPKTVNRGNDFPALVRETPAESKGLRDQVRKGRLEVSQADEQAVSRMSSSNAERSKTAAPVDSANLASTSKAGVSSLHLTDWTEDPDEEMNFSVPLDETLTGGALSQRKSPERKQPPETQPAPIAGDLKKASRPVGHFDWTDTEDEEDNSEPSVHSRRTAGSGALSFRHQLDKTPGVSELNPSGDHRMRADTGLSVSLQPNDAMPDTRTLPVTHHGDAKEVSLAELSRELEILEEERQIAKQKAAERARQRREEEERLEKERRERAALKLRELEERIAAKKAQKEAASQSTSRDARGKVASRGKTDKAGSPGPRSGFGDARSDSAARNASLFKAGGAPTKVDAERRQRSRERPTGALEAESRRDSEHTTLAGTETARQAVRLHRAPERARSGPTIRGHESVAASQGGTSMIALERSRAVGDTRRLVAAGGAHYDTAEDVCQPELGRDSSVPSERQVVKGPTGSTTSSIRSSRLPTETRSERNALKTWRGAGDSDDHADVRLTNHTSTRPLRHGEVSSGTHAAAPRLPLDVSALNERVLPTGPPSSWLNLPDAKITDDVAASRGHRERNEKTRRSATQAADGSVKWGLPDFPKPSFEDISRAFASTRPMMGSAPIAFGLAGLYSGNEPASTESRERTTQAASTLAGSSQRNGRDINTPSGDVGATPLADHHNLSSSKTVPTATALVAAAEPNDSTVGSESAVAPIASKASVTGSQLALSSNTESAFSREIPFHSDLRTDAPEFIPFVPYGGVDETGFVVAHADPTYIPVQYGDAAQADLFSLPGYLPSSDWGSTVLSDSVDVQHPKDSDERGENAGSKRKTHMDDDDEDLAAAAISSALGEHRHRRGKTINGRRRERNLSMAPSRNQRQSESNTQVQAPSKLREKRWSLSAAPRDNPTTSRPERRPSLALGPGVNGRNEIQCATQAGEDEEKKEHTSALTGETRGQRNSTDAMQGRSQAECEALTTRTSQESHSKDVTNTLSVQGMQVQSIRSGRASYQNRNRSSRVRTAKEHRDTERVTDKSVGTGHGRDRHYDETSDANEDEVGVNSGDKTTNLDGADDEHHRGMGGSGPQMRNQQLVRRAHDRSRQAPRTHPLKLAAQRPLRRDLQTQSVNIDQSASNTSTDASDPNASVQRPLLEAPLESTTAKGATQVATERPRQAPPRNRRRTRRVSKSSNRSAVRERPETASDSPNGAPAKSAAPANLIGELAVANVSLSSEAESPEIAGKQAVRHQHRRGRDAATARMQRRRPSQPGIDLSGSTNQNDDGTTSTPIVAASRDDLPKHNSVDDVAAQADTQSAVGHVSSSLATTTADVTIGDTTPVDGTDRPAKKQPRNEGRLQGRQHGDSNARRSRPPHPHSHRRHRGRGRRTPPGHGTDAQADERQSISGAAARTSGSPTESNQQTNR